MAEKQVTIKVSVRTAGIQQQIRKVNSNLSQLSNQANKANASLQRMGGGFRITATQIGTLTGGFFALQGAFRALRFGVTSMIEFEKSMSSVQAVSGATGATFQRMSNLARELGATTTFSANQAAEGLKFLSMAGFTAQESMNSLTATLRLAQAGAMDLGRSADIMSNIMKAMKLEAQDSAKAGDILAQAMRSSNTSIEQLGDAFKYAGGIAGSLGLNLEETTAALSVLSNAGLQASMAGTGLRQVLVRIANPSAAMREVFSQVGIEVDNLDLSAGNLGKTLRILASAGLSTGEIFKAFEARAGTAFTILQGGIGDFDALEKKNKNAQGTLEDMSRIMTDNLAGSIKLLQSAFSELFIAQEGLGQGMRGIVDTLTTFINILNGTATSTNAQGESMNEVTKTAMKLQLTLQMLGVALGALAIAKTIIGLRNLAISMQGLFVQTTVTTTAIGGQSVAIATTHQSAMAKMFASLVAGIANMIAFKNATLASTLVVRGFAVAIATTGIGAIVVALGYAIGKLMDMVAQSKATKAQMVGDAKAIADELSKISGGFAGLEQESSRGGAGADRIMELNGVSKAMKEIEKIQKEISNKPLDIVPPNELKNFEELGQSIKGMKQRLDTLKRIELFGNLGDEDQEEVQKQIALLNKQLALYMEHGAQIVSIRNQEKRRNIALEETQKHLEASVKEIETFGKMLNEADNSELRAEVVLSDARRKVTKELEFMSNGFKNIFNVKSGDVNVDSVRDSVLNAVEFDEFKVTLQTAMDHHEVESLDEAMNGIVEKNFNKIKGEMTSMLGETGKLTKETEQAIQQFAMLDSMELTSLGSTSDLFSQVIGDPKALDEARHRFEVFKKKIEEIKVLKDLEVNVAFNKEAESALGKLDAEIAQAKLELKGMTNEFEHSTRITGALQNRANALATTLRVLGKTRQDSFADIKDSDMFSGEFDSLEKINNLNKQNLASALRGIELLDKVRKQKAKNKLDVGTAESPKFQEVGEALKSAILKGTTGGLTDAGDLASLLVQQGFADSAEDVRDLLSDPDFDVTKLNKVFARSEQFAQQVRNALVTQGQGVNELAEQEERVLTLEQKRIEALDRQTQKLKEQREAVKGLEAQMEVDKLDADFKIGADDTTKADADMARAELELQKRLESFKNKARKILDEEVKAEVALKRGELSEQRGVDSDTKKKQLAEFENELRKKSNDKFAELVDKQARIFEQTRFAEQIENSIKSLKEKLDKFEKSRREQQDRATGFVDFAKDITAKEEEEQGDTREAGVSSLAKIGGGGGVGRGGDDKQQKIINVNERQADTLDKIAKSIFGVEDFQELGDGIKEDLIGAVQGIDKLVGEDKLTKDEGDRGLEEVAKRLAQVGQDREDKAVSDLLKLIKGGVDDEEAPDPLDNALVQNLIKSFDKLSENQQARAINRLRSEDAPDALINELLKNIGDNENFVQDRGFDDGRGEQLGKMIRDSIVPQVVTENEDGEIEVNADLAKDLFEKSLRDLGTEDFNKGANDITNAVANETGLQEELTQILKSVRLDRESKKPQQGLDFEQSPKFEIEVPKIDIPSIQPLKPIDAGQELAEKDSLSDRMKHGEFEKSQARRVASMAEAERNSVNDLAPLESIDQVQDSLAVPLIDTDLPSEVFDKFADSEEDRKKLIALATANRLNDIQADSGFVPVPSAIAGREGLMDVTRAVKMDRESNWFSSQTAERDKDTDTFFASSQARSFAEAGMFDERVNGDPNRNNSLILPDMSQGKDESLEDFMSRVDAMNERLKENRQKAIDMVVAMTEEGVDLPVISGEARTLEIGKDQDNKEIQDRAIAREKKSARGLFNINNMSFASGTAFEEQKWETGALMDDKQNARAVGKDLDELEIQEEKRKQEEANRLSNLEKDSFDPNTSNNASVKPIVRAPKTRLPEAEDFERNPMDVIKPIPSQPEPMPVKLDDIPIIHIPELKQLREGLAGGSIMASTEKKIPTPLESPIESLMQMKGESDVSGLDALVGLQTKQNKLLKDIFDVTKKDKPQGGGLKIEEL